jgi:hypothetical protein
LIYLELPDRGSGADEGVRPTTKRTGRGNGHYAVSQSIVTGFEKPLRAVRS